MPKKSSLHEAYISHSSPANDNYRRNKFDATVTLDGTRITHVKNLGKGEMRIWPAGEASRKARTADVVEVE